MQKSLVDAACLDPEHAPDGLLTVSDDRRSHGEFSSFAMRT